MHRFRLAGVMLLLASLCSSDARAGQTTADLTGISLDDLMKIEVTSVSKKEQELFGTASAVAVLTAEDIRRSGATSVVEVLRLVPGVHVSRLSGSRWGLGIRGFSSDYSNKVMVLLDGISVYDPIFGGVHWQLLEPALEDIDRIEVIRGPGATAWGANAVNGVINIVTKDARITQGAQGAVGVGSEDRGLGAFRYGGRLGNRGYFRAGVRAFLDGAFGQAGGASVGSAERRLMSSQFRSDLQVTDADSFRAQGELTTGELHDHATIFTGPTPPYMQEFAEMKPASQFNLLARWTRKHSVRSQSFLQGSATRTSIVDSQVPTMSGALGVKFQNHTGFGRHDVLWDLDYQRPYSDISSTSFVAVSREHYRGHTMSASIQDDLVVVPRTLTVTFGSNFTASDTSGFDLEPSVRASWVPHPSHAIWAAVSEAERTPSRFMNESTFTLAPLLLPGNQVGFLKVLPTRDVQSEGLTAYEAGYRIQLRNHATIDTAIFDSRYTRLAGTVDRGLLLDTSSGVSQLVQGLQWVNSVGGRVRGIETFARWQVRPRWMLDAAYAWTDGRFVEPQGVTGQAFQTPRHQGNLGSKVTLLDSWEADARVFVVGRVAGGSDGSGDIDAFARVDARISRSLGRQVNMSLVGQNLLQRWHREMNSPGLTASHDVPRSVQLKITFGL